MALDILCSGHLVRHPVGGHSWHHLQYLVGLQRLGHRVTFFEHYGWENSCWDPERGEMTSDPTYGLHYLRRLLDTYDLGDRWCYLAEDGSAHGMSREALAQACRDADLYMNLSNINWIPELELCRRRVLVDTDPVFTQIGSFGLGGPFSRYDALFTYGENVHRPGCSMPAGGGRWLPTRQPIVLDLWPFALGDPDRPFTSVMNWSPGPPAQHEGRRYGYKDQEFEPFFELPRETGEAMELAVNARSEVSARLAAGGWRLASPTEVSRDPWVYQDYLQGSRAEFSVSRHGYVSTRCGWFSDRTSSYLALGRPVVAQDTGFTDFLPHGAGLLAYRTPREAVLHVTTLREDYEAHCHAARAVAAECFDGRRVLGALLEEAL